MKNNPFPERIIGERKSTRCHRVQQGNATMRFGGTPRRSDGDRLPGRGIQQSGVVREMRKNPHQPLSIEVNNHQSSVNFFALSSWMAVHRADEAASSPLQKCGSLPSIVQIQRLSWIMQNIHKSIQLSAFVEFLLGFSLLTFQLSFVTFQIVWPAHCWLVAQNCYCWD